MQATLQGEALNSQPALWSCQLSQPLYYSRSSWNSISINRTETSPILSKLCSYITINIFNRLCSDQSGQCFLDQSKCKDLEFHLHEDWPIRDQGQGLLSILIGSPLVQRSHFSIQLEVAFPWSKLKHRSHLARPEQSCLVGEGPHLRATAAVLSRN